MSIARTLRPLSGSSAEDGDGAPASCARWTAATPSGAATEKTEPWPGHDLRPTGCSSTRPRRSNDRQAEAQPLGDPGALVEPFELLEHGAPPVGGDAEAGIPDFDAQSFRVSPATDQHLASHGILDRVGDQVLQQPAHQAPVGPDREPRRRKTKPEPFRARQRRELDFEHAHEVGDRDVGDLRSGGPGVKPRDIQEGAEDFLDRFQRHVDLAGEIRALVIAADPGGPFRERAGVEPRSVEGLKDVVARGGEEARLGEVRLLRDGLGARKLRVQPLQFGGALVDPFLEELVGRLERLLGLHGLCHVGVGRDDAAVGQPGRADLDHAVGGEQPEPRRLVIVEERGDPLGDEVFRISRSIGAAGGVEADDLVEPDAETQ